MDQSFERPAWTSQDLEAYKHRHVLSKDGRYLKVLNYYEKPCNQIGQLRVKAIKK